jgi:hypothetical protein
MAFDIATIFKALQDRASTPTAPPEVMQAMSAVPSEADFKRQALKKALAAGGAAMANSNGDFFRALGQGMAAGGGSYVQDDDPMKRQEMLRQVFDRLQKLKDTEMQGQSSLLDAGLALGKLDLEANATAKKARAAAALRHVLPDQLKDLADADPGMAIDMYRADQSRDSQRDQLMMQGGGRLQAEAAARKQMLIEQGGDPNSAEGRNFILTGNMERPNSALSATDKAAILNADDSVLATRTAIEQLESVLVPGSDGTPSLNERAGSGATAGLQAWAARNDPTGFR